MSLAEIFRDRGYETAAFVGSFVLDHRFGLNQGFDLYDDDLGTGADELESFDAERSGQHVFQSFATWLSERDPQKPFFAWVHLYDPHAPYEPPEPYRSRHRRDPYAGEIAFTDSVVGEILGALERRGLTSETLVAVTGDHGEGLGEHDEMTHSVLIYNEALHVPMILAGPHVPRGVRVGALARTIDLGATLLDYIGAEPSLGRGRSLRTLVEGETDERRAYSESLYAYRHLGWSPLYGLETERHHFIDAPEKELYDVSTDPNETVNVLQEHPSISRALFRELQSLRQRLGTTDAAGRNVDPETRSKLESLGYLTSPAPLRSGGLADPKHEMNVHRKLQQARSLQNRGACRGALEVLAGLDEPSALGYEILGTCQMALGNRKEAAGVFRRAMAQGYELPLFHLDLGILAYETGDLAEAEKELRIALALDGANVSAYYRLGQVLRAERRDDEAVEAFRQAVAINPRYVFAWNGLGMTLARLGRDGDALQAFRRAVEVAPEDAPLAHFNLAVQLERISRTEEALESYRRFLALAGEAFSRERARAAEAVRRLGGG